MSPRLEDRPALLGGPPIRSGGPPTWPPPDPLVKAAIDQAFASGAWSQYHGPNVCELEAELVEFLGVPHVLTCASGTLAVEAALRALNIGPGSDVLLAAYEYEPNFLTVHALGARPALADVSPNNWNLDLSSVERSLTPATRAIVATHLHGGLVPMRALRALADARGLPIVEDSAQATGALVEGKPAGTWGDIGTFSFGGSKLLAGGRGGAIVFRDARLHQRARLWLSRGVQQWAPLSELQAIVLRPQLAKLREATAHREASVARLVKRLQELDIPGLVAFQNMLPESQAAYYKLGFRYGPSILGLPRDIFLKAMRAEGIAFDAGFRALHMNRSPSRFVASDDLSEAARAHEECVILHHPVLSGCESDIDDVAIAVEKVYRNREQFL